MTDDDDNATYLSRSFNATLLHVFDLIIANQEKEGTHVMNYGGNV